MNGDQKPAMPPNITCTSGKMPPKPPQRQLQKRVKRPPGVRTIDESLVQGLIDIGRILARSRANNSLWRRKILPHGWSIAMRGDGVTHGRERL